MFSLVLDDSQRNLKHYWMIIQIYAEFLEIDSFCRIYAFDQFILFYFTYFIAVISFHMPYDSILISPSKN